MLLLNKLWILGLDLLESLFVITKFANLLWHYLSAQFTWRTPTSLTHTHTIRLLASFFTLVLSPRSWPPASPAISLLQSYYYTLCNRFLDQKGVQKNSTLTIPTNVFFSILWHFKYWMTRQKLKLSFSLLIYRKKRKSKLFLLFQEFNKSQLVHLGNNVKQHW